MKNFGRIVIFFIVMFLLFSCKGSDHSGKDKASVPEKLQARLNSITSPESDIIIFFNQDVITEAEGQIIYPEVSFQPALSGSFSWDNKKTLRFSPNPGQFSWGSSFKVTIGSFIPKAGEKYTSDSETFMLKLPRYSAGDKVASWDTVIGKPRFVSTLGSLVEVDQIGSGPLYLLYDQPVDPEEISRYLKLTTPSDYSVPYELVNAIDLYNIFGLDIDEAYVLALSIPENIEDGDQLVLSIPSWLMKDGEELKYTNITLTANKRFYVEQTNISGKRDSGAYEPNISMNFIFNNSIDRSLFMENFTVEPDPIDINYNEFWGNSISISLNLEIGETYKVYFKEALKDYLGNALEENLAREIRVRDHFPILSLPQYPLAMEADRAIVPVQLRNIQKASMRIYNFKSASDYIKALNKKYFGKVSAYGFESADSELTLNTEFGDYTLNEDFSTILDLSQMDDSGYNLLEVIGDATGSEGAFDESRCLLFQTADAGIMAKVYNQGVLAWVVGFSDAEPKIAYDVTLMDSFGRVLASGATDRLGLVTLDTKQANVLGVTQTLYLEAKKGASVSLMKLDNSELSGAWQFNLPSYTEDALPIYGSIFTERGVYRPNEIVHIKTYVHFEDRSVPSDMWLKVMDPRGKVLLDQSVLLDAFGAADFELSLPEKAAVGQYNILLYGDSSNIYNDFLVEEYRVPTFVVNVDSSLNQWLNGQSVPMIVNAEYYNGSLMDGREVSWTVRRRQAPVHFSDFPDYIFQAADILDTSDVLTSGKGTLNSEGNYQLAFTPSQNAAAGRLRYTFEAVVTDVDRQAYAGRISKMVDPGDYYVGVKAPQREVLQSGVSTEIPVVVVDTDGQIQSNYSVQIEVEFIQNHSSARMFNKYNVQLLNHQSGKIIDQTSLRSKNTPVSWSFTPDTAGIYRLNFSITDSSGRMVKTFFYTTVTGDEAIAWPRFDIEQIEVVRDKSVYRIGDVAKIIPQTPFREATGLVTIEQSGVMETRVFKINNNTEAIEIPITQEMSPNAYVSIVILRGRIHDRLDASGFETGAPAFKIGYTLLTVDPADQRLLVDIQSVPANTSPGQQLTVPVQVTDAYGKGIASQLTVMVVDQAVLDLTGYETPDPIADIYTPRPLGVRTGTNWLDLPHSRRERLERLFPSGSDDWDAADAMNNVLRDLFKSTAYWNPSLLTDSNGKAEFSFTMPDNLTTYRLMVVAADKSQRYGSSDKEMLSSLPLMIQPVLPRFAYPEDEFAVEALILNGTDKTENINVRVELLGLRLKHGGTEKSISLDAGKSGTVSFPVSAGISGNASIRFYADMSGESDAAEYVLPILNPGTQHTVVDSCQLSGDSTITLDVPSYHINGTLSAEAVVSKTALTELKDSVQYLMRYPNGCIEQTTSTAYPLVILDDLLPMIGVDVDRGKLKELADAGIKRILGFQTSQGGLSYWPGGSEPHAFATAFGLTALIAARDKGYDIPAEALEGMADYLEISLRSGQIKGEMPHGSIPDGDTRALFVMTLGRLGRPQPQYINALWEKREQLTAFGLSFLAIAVEEIHGGDKSLLNPILTEIKKRAQIMPDEAYFEGSRDGGWSMGSPLRTHGGALLAYGVIGSDATTGGKFLSGLLERRTGGLWGNTQENVFGIMGVYEYSTGGSRSSNSGSSNEGWDLILQGQAINPDSLEAPDQFVRRVRYTEGELKQMPHNLDSVTLESSNIGGYLTLRLNYDVPLSKASFNSIENGFVFQRTYETLDGHSLEKKAIPLGSLVKVRLRVSINETRHYVTVDDRLPAGLEPLNDSLETTERVELGKLSMEAEKGISVLSYNEIRDSRVSFHIDEMIPGEYEFIYIARATSPGKFLRPAGRAEAMYEPEICGTTGMNFVEVK